MCIRYRLWQVGQPVVLVIGDSEEEGAVLAGSGGLCSAIYQCAYSQKKDNETHGVKGLEP